jgi:hypothetical protein
MNNVTITPTDNSPYLVQGSVTLLDAEGNRYDVSDGCRPTSLRPSGSLH